MERDKLDPDDVNAIRMNVRSFMPDVIGDLEGLIAIPSVAFPGYSREQVLRMAAATSELLRRYGIRSEEYRNPL